MKMLLNMRALQIAREMSIFKSWKTFFKQIFYKILGKSLAWELAKQEAIDALKKEHRHTGFCAWKFLQSDTGWGNDFEEKMARLLKQPH